jgi:hypothetical protein
MGLVGVEVGVVSVLIVVVSGVLGSRSQVGIAELWPEGVSPDRGCSVGHVFHKPDESEGGDLPGTPVWLPLLRALPDGESVERDYADVPEGLGKRPHDESSPANQCGVNVGGLGDGSDLHGTVEHVPWLW